MDSFFIGIIILLLSGFAACLFNTRLKIPVLAILNTIAAVLCIQPAVKVIASNRILNKTFEFNELFGAVNFQIDFLSAFFIIIICIMSVVTVIYANGYLKPYIEKGKNINPHMVFLPALTASMLGVVTCRNALMFLICWEIMSLSSFFLVIFENEKKEIRRAGLKYLVFMHISVIFIMLAFALLSIKSWSYDFSSFGEILQNNKHFANIIFALFFVGFGTKAGFVPFHNWLPEGHPAAPSHVSGIMSGVMIKTGIYGILRILSLMGTPSKSAAFAVLTISIITALYGILYAITQNDIKRLLAYSSIENIGIIGIGLGVGMLGMAYSHPMTAMFGFAGCLLHVLNHAVFKELLFLSAGSVYTKTHTRDIETLGGLVKSMPKTAAMFLLGSAAICGLPPLNGFISEFSIYIGMFHSLSIHNFFSLLMSLFAIAGLALVGTMAILCFSKAFSVIFLGTARTQTASQVREDNGKSMLLPMGFLVVLIFAIGIFPDYVFLFIQKPVSVILSDMKFNIEQLIQSVILIKIVAIFAAAFLLMLIGAIWLRIIMSKDHITLHNTWGCGYNKPNNRMQYTASSYASPFLSMLKPLFKKVFDIEKPRKLFPHSSHFSLHIEDIEEAYLINPLVKYDEWFLSKFEAIQSGNIQSYIKYGLVFLVLVIIGSIFL